MKLDELKVKRMKRISEEMNGCRRDKDGEKHAKVLEKARKVKIFNTFGENCILILQLFKIFQFNPYTSNLFNPIHPFKYFHDQSLLINFQIYPYTFSYSTSHYYLNLVVIKFTKSQSLTYGVSQFSTS